VVALAMASLATCRAPGPEHQKRATSDPVDRLVLPIDDGSRMVVPGTASPRARKEREAGPVDPTRSLGWLSLYLKRTPEQHVALSELLQDQQDPKSSKYRQWLTPEQFGERFGLTQHDLDGVTSWLAAEGFTVRGVASGRTRVDLSGTAEQVERVFKPDLRVYHGGGRDHFANASDVSVPVALEPLVAYVGGLNDFHVRRVAHPVQPDYTFGTSTHFVVPADFTTIYDLTNLYDWSTSVDGTGVNIAIVGETSIVSSDITNFRTLSGLPDITLNTYLMPGGNSSYSDPSDLPEAELDIEWSGAVARNATISYVYTGTDDTDALSALQYIVDAPAKVGNPTIVSVSYGACEQEYGSADAEYVEQWNQQGNAEGITIIAATGDSGAAACDDSGASDAKGLRDQPAGWLPGDDGRGWYEVRRRERVVLELHQQQRLRICQVLHP
jgi:subtilase family serine protease